MLSASSTTITIGGAKGRDESAQSVTLSLNTGDRKWPWTIVSPLPVWATASPMSGNVDMSGTPLSFSASSAATPGSYSAVVTVAATVNGNTYTLPLALELNRDKRKILPSEWGVGFAAVPAGSVLTKTLQVTDNFAGALPWTATSSASWLTATSSGTTGSGPGLTLSANPNLVPAGAMSYATVTLKTSDPAIETSVVNVGLWRANGGMTALTTLPITYSNVVADKIRPFIYAHNGSTFLDVYNAHLGTKIGTIANVGGALGDMTVAPDGSRLYVIDTPSKTAVLVDLATQTKVATWRLNANAAPPQSLLAIRTNGKDSLLADGGSAYVDGQHIATPLSAYGRLILTASSDGRRVFGQDTGFSPASVSAYDVDYTSLFIAEALTVKLTASASFINGASNGQDIAANVDGSSLYTASGAPYRCASVNPANLVFIGSLPGGDPYPNNIEVTTDGRVVCGIDGIYSVADIWVHAANGALLKTFKFAGYAKGLLPRQMVVTPDGMTVAALTSDPKIAFVPIGSP